jgi:hypothetical protein
MEFTSTDFAETLRRARFDLPAKPLSVLKAWGKNGDYSEWEGGFVLLLEDKSYAYITGWCDTTGWGCQDGFTVTLGESIEALKLPLICDYSEEPIPWAEGSPEDLNAWVRAGFKDTYDKKGIYDE